MTSAAPLSPAQKAQSAIKDGRMDEGLALAQSALTERPNDQDALYAATVAARYLGDVPKAQAYLSRLIDQFPEFGRAHQEAGHLFLAQGEQDRALAAYQLATQYDPALLASWRAIATLTATTDPRRAAAAQAQADHIARTPGPLTSVIHLISDGKLLKAERLCRSYLQKNPKDVEGMRLLADIGSRLNILDDAEFLLETACVFEPANVKVRLDYIQLLRKRQKYQQAFAQAEALVQKEPDNPLFQSHLAVEAMHLGDYPKALALFDRVLGALPNDPTTLTSKGHALKTFGRTDDAIAAYAAAIEAAPDHADAYYALANLKTYRFDDEQIRQMREQSARPGQAVRQTVHFHFSLGKAHEDKKDYASSFTHYQLGNDLKRRQSRYDADDMDAEFSALRDAFTAQTLLSHKGSGCTAPDPIFIVGLPRAGSTLLEQILASHSMVDGTMELPAIPSLAHRLRTQGLPGGRHPYPSGISDLDTDEFLKFGQDYIEKTQVHRKGAPFFIDKMPNNFRHIGLIHLILPNAKIIDARRAPMDCCFSGFKQLFAEGQEFTYGLEEIGRYYRGYVELMRHWDEVLPGRILRIQHEDVLDDLGGTVSSLLDHCGLPFEEACLHFHETERSVRTASSEQVRQPLNRKGVDQWRPYEPWLGPLKDALGPALNEYRS